MIWPWSQLGLSGPSELAEVRRAYAEKLKTTHPEEDPEGFQRLHSAYQLASRMARQRKRQAEVRPPAPQEEQEETPPQPESSGPREELGFEALPEQDEPPPHTRRGPEEERDFEFDKLLREEEAPPRPAPKEEEQDFDFDRLFAEGEAERAEDRRRRGAERRRAQERGNPEGPMLRVPRDEERWRSTEAILHTIEVMYNAQAEKEAWEKFLFSPLFQSGRETADLMFGLEDFVSVRNPGPELRILLFRAYGFEKGKPRPELRPLYQMLLPAWRAEKRKQWKNLFYTILGVPIAMAVMLAACMILVSGWFLGFAALGIGAVFGLKKGWLKRMPERIKKRKISGYTLCFLAGGILAAAFMLPGLRESVQQLTAVSDPREQVCRYLEEDFGEAFRPVYNKNAPDERYSNVFALEDDPAKQFMAGPSGQRDEQNGKPGYTANYPEMRMLWALKEFAGTRGISGVDSADRSQGLERWNTSGTFLITLPFYGAEDTITALGALLDRLAQERWYQVRTPDCELVLCGGPMRAGRLVISRYKPADGAFDTQGIRTLYQDSFTQAYCAELLKELELDRDFLRGGETPFTLAGGEMTELKGETCCKLLGLDEAGKTVQEYYVSVSGTTVYCVPGDFWETGGTEEQISFYRVLHRKDSLEQPIGVVSLFYPWLIVIH